MLKPFLNVALAVAGATGIYVVNVAPQSATSPTGTAQCAATCTMKPGECKLCPDGRWCCLDDKGSPQCCDSKGGKCAPCPMEKCGPGGCPIAGKAVKCTEFAGVAVKCGESAGSVAKWAESAKAGGVDKSGGAPCCATKCSTPCGG